MNIHPTAIVSGDARIDASARVGPYALIDGPAEIAAGCAIGPHAVITGAVRLGAGTTVGPGAVIGAPPQDLSFDAATESSVEIGARTTIREMATVHRGTEPGSVTRVGDGCYLMAGSHVGHNCVVEDRVIMANNVLLGGRVTVGEGAFLGGASIFHQYVRVGRLAMAQGGSGFGQDLPPFTVGADVNRVAGLNVVGMRRVGMSAAQRAAVKEAFRLVYRSGLNLRQALERAEGIEWAPEAAEFLAFVRAAGKRGICYFGPGAAGARGEAAGGE